MEDYDTQDGEGSWCSKCRIWVDSKLRSRGWSPQSRALIFHYSRLTWEQVTAVVPISLIQVLVLAIFFKKTSSTPGIDAAGLISAIVGLVLFLEGLRVAIMPMALLVGAQLPVRLKLPLVLVVAFVLGVLVTYAEPAIAAIRPLAKLVDPINAPYLYYMMNQQQELLVLAIGLGVGLASVVGTLKFLSGISIKPFIAGSLLPTVGLACYMQWGNPALSPILGVAWDCGGVTTGPVTVPILLSLGVGVMKAQRQKQMALAVLEDAAVKQSEGNTLEGFGIVTLASLLPVLAVEVMAILTSVTHSYDYVLEQASLSHERANSEAAAVADTSPVKEVIFGVRAIGPLVVVLLLLVRVVLRQPLPDTAFAVDGLSGERNSSRCSSASSDDSCGSSNNRKHKRRRDDSAYEEVEGPVSNDVQNDSYNNLQTDSYNTRSYDHNTNVTDDDVSSGYHNQVGVDPDQQFKDVETGLAAAAAESKPQRQQQQQEPGTDGGEASTAAAAAAAAAGRERQQQGGSHVPKVAAAVVIAAGEADNQDYFEGSIQALEAKLAARRSRADLQASTSQTDLSDQGLPGDTAATAAGSSGGVHGWIKQHGALLIAILMCQVGMILFNIGLTYGFTALGDMTGSTLPASFLAVPYEPGSPYYSLAGGIVLTMVVIFALGFAATNAEPALNVLGQTVETLSNGKFTKKLLVYAVCVGVAVGMCAGGCKILFRVPLLYFILAKYFVACCLTYCAKEAITAVAWDSAGVTTGPVTVPFVMSIGVGFSKAVGAPEGFGMLTIMSVAPIISVLTTSLLRKPVKRAAVELARISRASLSRISRRSNRHATSVASSSLGNNGSDTGNDTVIDFAAELAKNPNWTPSLGRSSPMGLGRASPLGLSRVSPMNLARMSKKDIGQTSRPLQTIGEHSTPAALPGQQYATADTQAATAAAPGGRSWSSLRPEGHSSSSGGFNGQFQ